MALPSWGSLNPFVKADAKATGAADPKPAPQDTDDPNDPNKNKDLKNKNKPGEGDDPLLKFDSLWQPNVDKDGKEVVSVSDEDTPYLPNIDPTKMQGMIDKLDFTKNAITPEEMELLKTGGEAAIPVMLQMMNRVSRQAFATAFNASTRVTEQGFKNARGRFSSSVPDHIRDLMVDSELETSLPWAKNPALAPVVKNVKSQYLKKFPKATPSELNNAVKEYFTYMKGELTKEPESSVNTVQNTNTHKLKRGEPTADFEAWLGNELDPAKARTQFVEDDNPQQ
jgi:hypothetical protein